MNRGIHRSAFLAVFAVGLATSAPASAETISTLSLDGLSFVSFQDEEILSFPSSSTICFHFGEPLADGVIPFAIQPSDVTIPDIPLGGGRSLRYELGQAASGVMRPTVDGRVIEFTAAVNATLLEDGEAGTFTYTMPFTTETVAATNLAGSLTIEITGLRLEDGTWYAQIVGATVNKVNAFPEPGAAVYTVLSGSFDQLP